MLNESPWGRQETFTRVVGGIGSGVFGEKEIYSTFFVRLLSARPVREALVRVKQIQDGYDQWTPEQQREFDLAAAPGLDLNVSRWIVVAVAFRSNDPNTERAVKQFLLTQTLETMRNRTFLSTEGIPQLRPSAYFPPRNDGVGARFVFPREFEGSPVVSPQDKNVTFELDVSGMTSDLVTTFPISDLLATTDGDGGRGLVLRPGNSAETKPTSEEASIAGIRDYRVLAAESTPTSTGSTLTLEEAVNPFPAGRRGRLHGSVYEYHRNDNFDARNFFDPLGAPLPEYKRNQFGFSLVAALTSNLDLLASYDGLRVIKGSTLLSHVPTPEMKQGDFSALLQDADAAPLRDPLSGAPLLNNRIPAERIHPVAKRLLAVLPDPNRNEIDRNFVNNQPVTDNRDALTLKVDYRIRSNTKLAADYDLSDSSGIRVHPLPGFGANDSSSNQDFRLDLNHSFSSKLLMDLHWRFIRSTSYRLSRNSGQVGLLASLGIAGVAVNDALDEGYPAFDLSGYSSFGDQLSPVTSAFNGFFSDLTLTYAMDAHTLRWGAEIDRRQFNNYRYGGTHRGRFVFNGYYSGDAFADFLFGVPESASRAVGSDRSDLRGSNWQFFVRDSWKLSPRLNASLGLTYCYFPAYRSVHANISGFHPLLFEPGSDGELVVAGSDRARQLGFGSDSGSMVFSDRDNLAPRLGVSFNPLGSSRLVFRGSYGIGYETPGPGYFLSYLGHNYPFYYMESANAAVDNPGLDLADPFQTAVPAELNVRGIEPHLRTPYQQSWQVSAESEFLRHWSMQASYDGQRGTRSLRVLPANVPLPGAGTLQTRRPNPAFGRFTIVTNSGSFGGHALDLEAGRRFADGLSFRSGLRWNRMFSDAPSGNPNNVRNLRAEKAPVGYQPNRTFFLRYIFDLPFGKGRWLAGEAVGPWAQWLMSGWRLSGITHVQDGTPFSVYLAGDVNNDGLSGERPDRLGPGRIEPSQRSIDRWFAVEEFAAPAQYSFGNAGRNILTGPGYQNWDVSIIKQTRFSDGDSVELRIELFNAFNQVNFEEPNALVGNSVFGKIFGAGRAREIEVALKYSF